MTDRIDAPSSVDVSEARQKLAEILRRVAYGSERIVLRRHGRPMAALVAWTDLERLQHLEDLDDARAADATHGEKTVSLDWARRHRKSLGDYENVPASAEAVRETPVSPIDRTINIVVHVPEQLLDSLREVPSESGEVRDAALQLVQALELLARHSNIEIRPTR